MRRRATGDFRSVLDVDMVDEWLSSGARRPNIRMVKAGTRFDEGEYTRTVRMGGLDVRDAADAEAIARLFSTGATLVMQNLELSFAHIRRLVDQLHELISHPVQANAYLTPPSAVGLGRHADTHDVVILQIHGSKTWDVDGLGQFELGPGDVVYLPRGTPHQAHTSTETSLHITFGILQVTTRQVLRRMLDRLDHDGLNHDLDESLPVGFALMDEEQLADVLRPRIERAIAGLASVDLVDVAVSERTRMAKRQSRRGRGALMTALRSADLALSTRLRRVADCRLEMFDDRVELHLPDRTLSFPPAAATALRVVCESRDMSAGQFDGIDEPSRLVVARRLIREGALAVAPATVADSDG
jgi:hypothetical protein